MYYKKFDTFQMRLKYLVIKIDWKFVCQCFCRFFLYFRNRIFVQDWIKAFFQWKLIPKYVIRWEILAKLKAYTRFFESILIDLNARPARFAFALTYFPIPKHAFYFSATGHGPRSLENSKNLHSLLRQESSLSAPSALVILREIGNDPERNFWGASVT